MRAISLKTMVRLAIIGAMAASVVIIGVMTAAYMALDRIQNRIAVSNAVSANVGRLNLLTAELLLHQSDRVIHQWRRQQEILIEQLALMRLPKGQASVLANEMLRRLEALPPLIDKIEGPLVPDSQTAPLSAGAREIISESIIAQAGAILSQSIELREVLASSGATTRKQIFLLLGGGFLAVTIGGGLILLLISNRLLSRILNLRAVVQKLGEGDLETEIPLWMRDEMGEVFRQLDQMRRGLLRSMGDLSRVNLELVAAKASLEDRVAERTAGLEAANRELEAFTYAVSHDLRAPLRRIAGFNRAVLDEYGNRIGEDGADLLKRSCSATQQMNELIEDLLKLSTLNQQPIQLSEANLSKIAAEICESLKDRDPQRHIAIKIEPDVIVPCDPRLMRIALTNLIENAWKFSAGNTEAAIEFGQRIEGAVPTIFVRDNGAGFDMAFAAKLFQPFQRLHSAKDFPGTGIGLATVARIIRLHGGKIWAESRPSHGASFHFRLGQTSCSRPEPDNRGPAAEAAGADSSRSAPLQKAAGVG